MPPTTHHTTPATLPSLPSLPEVVARGALGGTLMGLANLVPGISGGTMLVVAGIFTLFIGAMADVTAFRFTRRALVTLASVAIPAALAILLLAGEVRDLVIERRWIMYSLFIGWTLGGIPALWAMARSSVPGGPSRNWIPTPRVLIGAAVGLAVMVVMVAAQAGGQTAVATAGGPGMLQYLIGGMVAAAAMVLPGVSGGYLLLLMGLYVPILDAIDQLKQAVSARDVAAAMATWRLVIPLGLGVGAGIVGVSHLVKWLLERFEQLTLGVLLGLLLGAFLGLYPFQRPVEPEPGAVIKGRVVTQQMLDTSEIKAKDWPTRYFTPSAVQVGWSILLIGAAASSTLMIARVGRRRQSEEVNAGRAE
jgi:putative membrane protein